MKNTFDIKRITQISLLLSFLLLIFSACDFRYDIAEAGSKPDLTPPKADFNYSQGQGGLDQWKIFSFGNLSTSATDYVWNFPDGSTVTTLDTTYKFADEGTFDVTLTAKDKLGATNSITKSIEVVKPLIPAGILPVIHEPGFEDGDSNCGPNMDGRDCWRIPGGAIFGITSSPVRTGSQAAKFDAGSNRVAYQELTVSPNTSYTITIFYTIKTSPGGSQMRLAVSDPITNASQISTAIFKSTTGNDQSDANSFTPLTLTFDTGARTKIGLWIDSNNIAESRVDDVSISIN
ncbi:PKD domain-containing protein [Kaistella flava (ex Peng et al. 2021)]|uniref:PKD domain-containing protein n=1 Tax=Kaistella flava (ex Peng et al. 2021) TaxID=2038776 RepID=A0A7M2Y817_9FLAO|nr:PKD domain-containing protein [Kaistella flava (ex Peng et al. 2021)]QOW10407.1 PKD domain-containing protein [Kaistella flava (ex Peng et al. 2021)]